MLLKVRILYYIVNIHSFGTINMPGVDHNSNSSDYSVSDSNGSVDFKTDQSCPMKVDVSVNKYTSCTIVRS